MNRLLPRGPLVALVTWLAGCGGGSATDAAVLGVDVAGCQPVRYGSVVGFALRADAPLLEGGRRYRCVIFPGTAERRVQLTVFAQGFRPTIYLLDPGEAPRRLLAWSDEGPGAGVARSSVVLPRTTPYAAVVAAGDGEAGTFLISVQDSP